MHTKESDMWGFRVNKNDIKAGNIVIYLSADNQGYPSLWIDTVCCVTDYGDHKEYEVDTGEKIDSSDILAVVNELEDVFGAEKDQIIEEIYRLGVKQYLKTKQ